MPRPAQSLKAKALACIAQREHSRVELRRKLLAHIDRQQRQADATFPTFASPHTAPTARDIDELLDWLVAKDLLNAERFIETRVNARASRFGNLRILQELTRHGVEPAGAIAAELKHSELLRARAVWAKRFGQPAADAAGRAKQMRFLAARGFSADVIRRAVAGGDDD